MTYNDVVTPIMHQAAVRPHHPAFVFGSQVMTYGMLVDQARRVATVLKNRGVRAGDRIGMLSPNRPEIFSIYVGLAWIGAAIVPINTEYAPEEVRYILDHSEARFLVRTLDALTLAREAVASLFSPMEILDFDALLASAESVDPYAGEPLASDKDLVLLCYTSGTTARPKGVAATHCNEIASGFAYRDMWAITPDDRILVTLPLSFSYGFHAATFVSLIGGATVLLVSKFHPRLTLEMIESLKPSVFLGVPTMYAMMAEVARKSDRRYDLSSLRFAAASGASLNEQVVQDCQSMLGLWVRPYYAMTEVRPIFSFDLRKPGSPPPGSVGQLIPPTEVKIVDETGNEVSADESGELWVKGPSFSGAYYRDPQRTAEALSGEWFRTGDIVYRDQDGNYFIIGRNRDQIISGGAKIAPVEVEDAILTHPGVAAAAVIGVADPMYGQIVKAFVVRSDPHLKENDIIAHCEKRIADYKVPRVVMFMASLPVAPSGKVLKSALT